MLYAGSMLKRRVAWIAVAVVIVGSWALGQSPRVRPVRPVKELLSEALRASPPRENGTFLAPDLVELRVLDADLKLDIRYATTNNFLGTPIYDEARAFLQRPAALAVVRVDQKVKARGYGLLVFDGYRPWYVTKVFWDATPVKFHPYVSDPAQGSRHNRGCAIDLTLFDLKTGQPLTMPTDFDDFSVRAWPSYSGGTVEERQHREILRQAMESEGFTVYPTEWWHYDYKNWKRYQILNRPFSDLSGNNGK